jgi:hypothetical protein
MPTHSHHLHHVAPITGSSDHWFNVVLALAAIVTVAAFAGSAYLASTYGRKVSVSVSADIDSLPNGNFLLRMHPVVRAVGLFRVKFQKQSGATLTVTEISMDTRYSGEPKTGQVWSMNEIYGPQHKVRVEPGEEWGTTVIHRLYPPSPRVVGWSVELGVTVKRRWWRFRSPTFWSDRVFVPRPISTVDVTTQ